MENPAAMQDEFRRGYRFTPTDDVLLEEYLYPFICGQPYHPYISEANIYADHPSNIFGPSDHLEDDDVSSETIVYHRYFFTRLTKKSQKSGKSREEGAKYIRRVQVQDGGTWHNDKPKSVKDKYGRVIGSRRYLKYAENPKIVKKYGRSDVQWKMYEFALDSKFLPIGHDGDLVVCRIIKEVKSKAKSESPKYSKKRGRKLKERADDEDYQPQNKKQAINAQGTTGNEYNNAAHNIGADEYNNAAQYIEAYIAQHNIGAEYQENHEPLEAGDQRGYPNELGLSSMDGGQQSEARENLAWLDDFLNEEDSLTLWNEEDSAHLDDLFA